VKEAGYSLLEVIIAFAIASTALITLYRGTGTALDRGALASARLTELAVAENIMERVGLDYTLEESSKKGETAEGVFWSLEIEAVEDEEGRPSGRWRLYRIHGSAWSGPDRQPVGLTSYRIGKGDE
jgi:type II secretory pathway component PulJ